MQPAVIYTQLDNNQVQCQACSHSCAITEGQTGICGVRKNISGELNLLVYGKPVALQIDPIEKKPLYHFLPGTEVLSLGTVGCNFRCDFCQNDDISQFSKGKDISDWLANLEDWPPERVVQEAVDNNLPSIAYTYNEPAIFVEYAHDIMKLAQEKGIKNVYVSNGFESKEAWDYVLPFLDAINIDLKSFSNEFYQKICGGRLAPVLDNIKKVFKQGVHLEITTLVIPGENDSAAELKQIAEFIANLSKDIPWHLSRFHPAYKMMAKEVTSYESLFKARELGLKVGLKYIYLGNV